MYFYRYVDDIEEFFAQSAQRHRGRDFLGVDFVGWWYWVLGFGFKRIEPRRTGRATEEEVLRSVVVWC